MMHFLLQLLLLPLPWSLRRYALRRLLKFEVDRTSYIGWSIVSSRRVVLGARARIGSLTLIKGLNLVLLEEGAQLGNLNWVTGTPAMSSGFFIDQPERQPALLIRAHAAITHRHLIDCTDTVEIGAFTTFAGWGSQILTHSIDIGASRQRAAAVRIGSYCFIGTRTVFLKGAALPDFSILAAGSVYAGGNYEPFGLFSGVPASRVRELNPNSAYFLRKSGHVS